MDLSAKVLGTGIVGRLQERRTATVLRIGKDRFTRAKLAEYECFNYQAAAALSATLDRDFDVANTRALFDQISPLALALPRIGAIAVAVLGAAFQAKGIGGDTPLENWVRHHQAAPDAAVRTFVSVKIREAKARTAERAEQKQRQRARRAKAHSLRRDRFHARSGATA